MKIKKWRPPDKWPKKPKACKLDTYRLSTSADFFAGYSSAYRASRYALLDNLSISITSGIWAICQDLRFYKPFSIRFNKTATRIIHFKPNTQPGTFNLCTRALRGLGFDFCGGGYVCQH